MRRQVQAAMLPNRDFGFSDASQFAAALPPEFNRPSHLSGAARSDLNESRHTTRILDQTGVAQ